MKLQKIIALLLVLCLLLGGCNGEVIQEMAQQFGQILANNQPTEPADDSEPTLPEEDIGGSFTAFADIVYTRPDMDAIDAQLQVCLDAAPTATDAEALMEEVYAFYDLYYDFYTNYSLANIHNSQDLTDDYWGEEYNFCLEQTTTVDAGLDELLYTLAACPVKEGLESEDHFGAHFFDDYQGESIWDETFTALMDQENALLTQYYDLAEDTQGNKSALVDVFVALVAVRQKMADHLGYDSYMDFAYEYYFSRDYSPAQAIDYMEQVQTELLGLYSQLDSSCWRPYNQRWSESKTMDYVRQCANTMGGVVKDAFDLLEQGGFYDISVDDNKYDASYETYLYSYDVPFIFMNSQGNGADPLTFTHEFGHFCNDYAAGGSNVSIDVAEIFSQGLEYLSLEYCDNTSALAKMKMADSLCVFVEQSLYASFEHQVYLLKGDELTAENVEKLFTQVGTDFGFSSWSWDSSGFVYVPHFYIAPMYVISYVVSNDAALQIYQEEQKEAGRGLILYMDSLDTEAVGFLEFLDEAGLSSPFYEGRVAEIRETLEEVLK